MTVARNLTGPTLATLAPSGQAAAAGADISRGSTNVLRAKSHAHALVQRSGLGPAIPAISAQPTLVGQCVRWITFPAAYLARKAAVGLGQIYPRGFR